MTQSKVTFCNTVTGRIVGIASYSSGASADIPTDCISVDGTYPHDEYYYDINDSQIKPKEEVTLTWDTTTVAASETATLSGLPIPCTVYVETANEIYVDDGTLEVTFTDPGRYKVIFDELAYKQQSFEIEVT